MHFMGEIAWRWDLLWDFSSLDLKHSFEQRMHQNPYPCAGNISHASGKIFGKQADMYGHVDPVNRVFCWIRRLVANSKDFAGEISEACTDLHLLWHQIGLRPRSVSRESIRLAVVTTNQLFNICAGNGSLPSLNMREFLGSCTYTRQDTPSLAMPLQTSESTVHVMTLLITNVLGSSFRVWNLNMALSL